MSVSRRSNGSNVDAGLVETVLREVHRQCGDLLPHEALRGYAREAIDELQTGRVHNFLTLLATRQVLERVRESVGGWRQRTESPCAQTAEVLFVCIHNSGRSVMAEHLFNQLAGERELNARARSAGTHPGSGPNPIVLSTMREIGIDVSGHRPQLLTEEMARDSDYIFSMGCAVDTRSCPSTLIRGMEDWGLDDPHGKSLEEVRLIRDQVRRRVEELLDRLAEVEAAGASWS